MTITGSQSVNTYKRTESAQHAARVMLDLKKLTAELDEHRYYLELNVARRTEHLLKRIALLEACNATLCEKMDSAQKELASLQQDKSAKLFALKTPQREESVSMPVVISC